MAVLITAASALRLLARARYRRPRHGHQWADPALSGACLGALAFAVGAATGSRALALGISAGVAVLTYLASGFFPQVEGLEHTRDL